MKRSELYLEYARVLEMCEGTEAQPQECVKYCGAILGTNPIFEGHTPLYTFAVGIVEGKPVFFGDRLYLDGKRVTLGTTQKYLAELKATRLLSWEPPAKKTFALNGEELPLPIRQAAGGIWGVYLCFDNKADSEKVREAFGKIML